MQLFTTRESWHCFKQKMSSNKSASAELEALAGSLLDEPPVTILDRPPGFTSLSPDPHDYFSLGPYWWPNPSMSDGLPYIRRDGEVNPEFHLADRTRLDKMVQTTSALVAQAFVAAEPEPFARKAVEQIRAWFIAPETRMNPNLEYGQAIPGITKGRGIGIIDTISLTFLLDTLDHLPGGAWTASDDEALRAWFAEYLNWLLTSDHGKAEAKEHNNHGTWYDVQVIAFALFTGNEELARTRLKETALPRILDHIVGDGRQPHELSRTLSLSYSTFNLLGFICIVEMAKRVDIDIWHDEDAISEKLGAAIQFLMPYYKAPATWPYQQISDFKPNVAMLMLSLASQRANTWIVPDLNSLKPKPWNYVTFLGSTLRKNEGELAKSS